MLLTAMSFLLPLQLCNKKIQLHLTESLQVEMKMGLNLEIETYKEKGVYKKL